MVEFWQVCAGGNDRQYIRLCLEWGIILNGPGNYGAWSDEVKKKMKEDGWPAITIKNLTVFAEVIKDSDVILLRYGKKCYGIGYVYGDYEHNDNFCDVDGWKLQHTRRVKWVISNFANGSWLPIENINLDAPATTAKKAPKEARTLAEALIQDKTSEFDLANKSLKSFPTMPSKLGIKEALKTLYDYGIGARALTDLSKKIEELSDLAAWYSEYYAADTKISEHETVIHLVAPLLEALGWTAQCMATEWQIDKKRVDIALFTNGNRNHENIAVLVEAKKFSDSCLKATSQVKNYAERISSCERLVVTDGIRYGVLLRENNKFKDELDAYLNLTDLRSDYPVYPGCDGAKKALLYMSDKWHSGLKPLRKNDDASYKSS